MIPRSYIRGFFITIFLILFYIYCNRKYIIYIMMIRDRIQIELLSKKRGWVQI